MKKLLNYLNYLSTVIWPWSRLRRAESLSLRLVSCDIQRDQNEMYAKYHLFLLRELGQPRMSALTAKFNSEIESLTGFQGALGRPDKDRVVFVPIERRGEIDPKLGEMGQALAKAAREVQERQRQQSQKPEESK